MPKAYVVHKQTFEVMSSNEAGRYLPEELTCNLSLYDAVETAIRMAEIEKIRLNARLGTIEGILDSLYQTRSEYVIHGRRPSEEEK